MNRFRWRRALYPLRSLRFSLKNKTFFKLLLIFIIPFALTGAFFIESQRRSTERLVFESFITRIQLIAIDLENVIKDRANLQRDNPNLRVFTTVAANQDAGRTPRLPDRFGAIVLPPALREAAAKTATDHRSLMYFFRDPRDAKLLLFFALREGQNGNVSGRWSLYLFDAAFLEDAALENANVNPEETLLLTDAGLNPVLSSRIEADFQIPPEWAAGLKHEFRDGFFDGLRVMRVGDETHLVLCSRFDGLPLVGVLTRPYDDAMAGIYETVRQQALILAGVAVILFLFSGFLARDQIRPLLKIQALMERMAENRYQPIDWNHGNDERRDIIKMLNRIRRAVSVAIFTGTDSDSAARGFSSELYSVHRGRRRLLRFYRSRFGAPDGAARGHDGPRRSGGAVHQPASGFVSRNGFAHDRSRRNRAASELRFLRTCSDHSTCSVRFIYLRRAGRHDRIRERGPSADPFVTRRRTHRTHA